MIKTSEDNVMDEEEDVIEHPMNLNQRDINITTYRDHKLLNSRYSLAKQPPHKNLTVEKLMQKFGTTNFLLALSAFLCLHFPHTTLTPNYHDHFDAYKQIVLSLPSN